MNRTTRVALAALIAPAAVLALPPVAQAGAPTRIDAEYWGVDCVTALGDGQTLFLFGSGTTDGAEGGVGAFVEDVTGAVVAEGAATSFGFGSSFTTAVDLGGRVLTIDAAVARLDSVTEPVEERDGNRWTKGTTTTTGLEVTPVSASYGGEPVALGAGACTGDVHAFDVRTTEPAAYVHQDSDFDSEICAVDGLADAAVRVSGALPTPYVEVVLDHGGEDVEKAQGAVRLHGGRGAFDTDVLDYVTGQVRTTARVGLALEQAGSRTREVSTGDGATERRTLTPYRETVTVSLADGRAGTAHCAGVAVETRLRIAPAR